MANKKDLKHAINMVCDELLVECVAASLYGTENHSDNADAVLYAIIRMQSNFVRRISHPEPGMIPKNYFKDLKEKFSAEASDILDQINNL